MRRIEDSTVLLVQPFLYDLAGSEMIVLELADALIQRGVHVAIGTWGWGERLGDLIQNISGVALYQLDSNEFQTFVSQTPPDLVWSHQGLVPPELLENPDSTRFVFAHLSSFNSFEFPFVPSIEVALASRIYFVSRETQTVFEELDIFADLDPSKIRILGNPAPAGFHTVQSGNPADLQSVLVVSNHIPDELISAIHLLRTRGLSVTVVGARQDGIDSKPQRVTPDLIANHDGVVSIGKTVQYGLCVGTPVYCYDHFGGPGWLLEGNYQQAEDHNFSGRGFAEKDAEEIAKEILDGYREAHLYALATLESARRRFSYDRVINDLQDVLNSAPPSAQKPTEPVLHGYLSAHRTVRDFGETLYAERAVTKLTDQHVANLEGIVSDLQSRTLRFPKPSTVLNFLRFRKDGPAEAQ